MPKDKQRLEAALDRIHTCQELKTSIPKRTVYVVQLRHQVYSITLSVSHDIMRDGWMTNIGVLPALGKVVRPHQGAAAAQWSRRFRADCRRSQAGRMQTGLQLSAVRGFDRQASGRTPGSTAGRNMPARCICSIRRRPCFVALAGALPSGFRFHRKATTSPPIIQRPYPRCILISFP